MRVLLAVSILCVSCESMTDPAMNPGATQPDATVNEATMDPKSIPAFSANGNLHAVIEVPAGTSDKREYDPATKSFPVNLRDGKPRRISFLPYPANYGFIPQTHGEDGDPLDVVVIVEHDAFPGCLIEVRPVGVLVMRDDKGLDHKILAASVNDHAIA